MGALKGYVPRNNKYVEAKNKLVNNVENFCKGREKIIKGFKNKVFPVYYNEAYKYYLKPQKETDEREKEQKKGKGEQRKKNKKKYFQQSLMMKLCKKNKINHLAQIELLNQ